MLDPKVRAAAVDGSRDQCLNRLIPAEQIFLGYAAEVMDDSGSCAEMPHCSRRARDQLPKLDVCGDQLFVVVLRRPGESYSEVILRLAAVGHAPRNGS
jgi:hypothetical protein